MSRAVTASARQVRAGSVSAGQGGTGPGGAMKGRSVPDRAGQDLAWSAEPDRGGKGSVRQFRARQDSKYPG